MQRLARDADESEQDSSHYISSAKPSLNSAWLDVEVDRVTDIDPHGEAMNS